MVSGVSGGEITGCRDPGTPISDVKIICNSAYESTVSKRAERRSRNLTCMTVQKTITSETRSLMTLINRNPNPCTL